MAKLQQAQVQSKVRRRVIKRRRRKSALKNVLVTHPDTLSAKRNLFRRTIKWQQRLRLQVHINSSRASSQLHRNVPYSGVQVRRNRVWAGCSAIVQHRPIGNQASLCVQEADKPFSAAYISLRRESHALLACLTSHQQRIMTRISVRIQSSRSVRRVISSIA